MVHVQWKTPNVGQRNCPKHVEFYSKNKIWEITESSWFYYKNLSRCTVSWTWNSATCFGPLSDVQECRSNVTGRSSIILRSLRYNNYLYIFSHFIVCCYVAILYKGRLRTSDVFRIANDWLDFKSALEDFMSCGLSWTW